MSLPKDDVSYNSKTEMLEEIVSLLGGRVAEQLTLGDISTGASNDIERATNIAKSMVTKYGMSERLGARTFGEQNSEPFIGLDYGRTVDYSQRQRQSSMRKFILLSIAHINGVHKFLPIIWISLNRLLNFSLKKKKSKVTSLTRCLKKSLTVQMPFRITKIQTIMISTAKMTTNN